eukprot:130290_1
MNAFEQRKEMNERIRNGGKFTPDDVELVFRTFHPCKHFSNEIQVLSTPNELFFEQIGIAPISYLTSKSTMSNHCFEHCLDCIYCNTQIAIQIFLLQKNIKSSFKYYGLLAAHSLIRKQIVMKNKYIFSKVFESLCCPRIEDRLPNADKLLLQLIHGIKPIQVQWIIDSEVLTERLPDLAKFKPCMLCVIFKMIKYKKQNKIKDIKKQHNHFISAIETIASDTRKSLEQNIDALKPYIDNKDMKECGNSKCGNSHKYDITSNVSNATNNTQEKWENSKVPNKWYVCSGCKVTRYCSRNCQKYGWNKQNHRLRCNVFSMTNINDVKI